MRSSTNTQVFKALLLAGGASTFALASPAVAQDTDVGDDVQVTEPQSEPTERIVVTGSRIARRDFDSNSPIVTVDEGLLEQSSTAAIESNLNKLPQFTPAQTPTVGADIQPTATNTPGAATISLRGIGTNRNLVLIDGRRGTPGNASLTVDINTIPSAAVERVETISGGASATYGADAVAGVTNFILKSNFEGLELDGQLGITQEGDNFEYQLSGIMGTDFADGRGNVSLAMSMNTREANFQRDREWYRDLYTDPTIGGSQFFIPAPGVNFGFGPNQPDYSTVFEGGPTSQPGVTVFINPETGTAFTTGANGTPSNFGNDEFDLPLDGLPFKQSLNGAIGSNNTNLYLILPLTRYNAFARGNYEINDWIGVFGQAMFTHTETFTRNEPSPAVTGWTLNLDPTIIDDGELPEDLQTLLDSRPDPDAPFELSSLLFDDRETFTDVTTYNLTAGLEGFVPGTSLAWEAYVSHGISSTYAKQTGVNSLERFQAVIGAPNFGRGFDATGNQEAPNFGFGAARATCTSGLNLFNPPEGGFSEDCLEAIRADLKNRSEVTQTIAEANVSGGLFDLWAGEVGAALGVSYREIQFEFDNDTLTTQGRSFIDQAQGIYPSGNVDAQYDVHEIYAELLIPLLSDLPLVQQFNLEVGGRISDYSTTGTSYTYKVLGDWEVTDWLRFRGGYNRAERAPNIGELFLQASQTFGGNSVGDPCSLANPLSFSANQPGDEFEGGNENGARVEAICRIQMEASGNPDADEQYYSGVQSPDTGGFAFPTTVGNPNLVPETADTWTAGFVIQPFFGGAISRARLTVDYFDISVDNAIGEQTVGIALRSCYDPLLNPAFSGSNEDVANSQFCQLVPRNATGALGNVQRTYVNNGAFDLSGIDVAFDLGIDVGPGTLSLNVLANYAIDFKSTSLDGILEQVDYVGTLGAQGENGLGGGNYEYRVFTTVGYNLGPAYLGLQWQHLPSIEDAAEAAGPTPTTGFPSYNLFNLNGTYALNDAVAFRFGVDNLFNKAPPLGGVNTAADPALGQLSGGGYNSLYYDTNGRRFYLGANVRF